MKCKRCGFDNPDYLEYCQNCAAPLEGKKGNTDREPVWGFVKAPKWGKPEFSADTVSDDDVPADFVQSAKSAQRAAYSAADDAFERAEDTARSAKEAAASAAGAAAYAVGKAKAEAKQVGRKIDIFADEIEDEMHDRIDDLNDDIDELEDDFGEEFDNVKAKSSPFAFMDHFKKSRRVKAEDDFEDEEDDDFEDEDDFEEYDDGYVNGRGRGGKGVGPRDLRPIIRIVGIIAALAALAAIVWLAVKAFKGCAANKTINPPVVEQSMDENDIYYVTVYAPEGTKLVYETAGGDRTPYTVQKSGYAKFRVPTVALLPGEPVDGATYSAVPKVLKVNADGTETPIAIDPIVLNIPSLELTFDNESDTIETDDGTAVISGRIAYIGAELTIDGEPVEIAGDGCFSRTLTFDEEGTYTVTAEAKLPNYQIARRTFNVIVNAPSITDPESAIQMPWDYGDTNFKQRVVNGVETISVYGKVPEGSNVSVSTESTNAVLSTAKVDDDGTFHFNVTMAKAGDYTITVSCVTPEGETFERDIHVQRQPDYASYIAGAWAADYSAFSYATSQQYKIGGKVTKILHEGDYYLAEFEMSDGHTIILEYHNHYGTAGEIAVGKSYSNIYGRSKGFDESGNIVFYVWFIND